MVSITLAGSGQVRVYPQFGGARPGEPLRGRAAKRCNRIECWFRFGTAR